MIPLRDQNPTVHPPHLTLALIALNVLVFFWQSAGSPIEEQVKTFQYAVVPYRVLGKEGEPVMAFKQVRALPVSRGAPDMGGGLTFLVLDEMTPPPPGVRILARQQAPAWLTLFTSMFMHGGWMHLIGNMLFLWIFGNNLEDALGKVRFLFFYLACGLVAAAAHVFSAPESLIPTIGASGAIGGVLGGYLVLYPKARITTLVPLGYIWFTTELPALIFLPIWFAMQFLGILGDRLGGGGVAYWAHIGGFLSGVLLVKFLETDEHKNRPRSRILPSAPRSRLGRRPPSPW
ncbi:MAG TPA: rhomboid family intramembrane serine protease [Planctomycetes bacterium]|nr:rhomboid family intramembrane serine protease [Planctomycetota bacterium]